jgi:hypothetical protein
MKGKNLLILVILAMIVLGIAALTSRKKELAPPDVVGTALLPKLDINAVEKIVIRSASDGVTLARIGDLWEVPSKFNYPAGFEKIKSALMKLGDIKIGQVVDASTTQKAELKMQLPPSSTNAPVTGSGTVVELFGKNGAKLGAVLIGESHMHKQDGAPADYRGYPDGQYVSNDGGTNVFLVKDSLEDMTADTKAWVEADLMNVQMSDISSIAMEGTNGTTVKLSRNKDTNLITVQGLSDKEETDSTKMSGVETVLAYLKFDDVADPSLPPGAMGLDKPAIFVATTLKGEIYTLRIGGLAPSGDGRYVKIEAAMTTDTNAPAAPKTELKKDENGKTAETAGDKPTERQETEKKIKALQDKFSRWTYVVASYKTDTMLTPKGELVKKKEEVKPEKSTPAPKMEEPKKIEIRQEIAPVSTKTNAPEAPKDQDKKASWWKRLWK